MLYILLSGVPPFWGETEQQIFSAILEGNLDFSSDPWPAISRGAKDAVRSLLHQVLPVLAASCDPMAAAPASSAGASKRHAAVQTPLHSLRMVLSEC